MEMFKIVYPEKREVSADFIRTKYADAVDNGEASSGLDNLADIMAELESQGFVTFITQPQPGLDVSTTPLNSVTLSRHARIKRYGDKVYLVRERKTK